MVMPRQPAAHRQAAIATSMERRMFCLREDGAYEPVRPIALPTVSRLPAGAYRVVGVWPVWNVEFAPLTPSAEPVFFLDTPEMRMVRREVEAFFDPATTARLGSAGLKHRRGIVLHGPPGTGKTSLVRQLFPLFVEHDAVIIVDCEPYELHRAIIPAIRADDPERPIVLLFDEFDKNVGDSRAELLQLLDGVMMPDHLLTIGCANDLRAASVQLRNRPSCFGLILRIDRLPEGVHERLAEQKYPTLSPGDRQFAVRLTRELPIDYLEEACKLLLMGYDPDEVRDRLHAIAPTKSAGGQHR